MKKTFAIAAALSISDASTAQIMSMCTARRQKRATGEELQLVSKLFAGFDKQRNSGMAAKVTFRDRHETAARAKRLWQCRVYLRGSEWLKNKTTCETIGHRERKEDLGRASMRAEHHILSAGVHKGIAATKRI